MLRRLLFGIALLALIATPSTAHASWSGYWTWHGSPAPGQWIWTWVWTVPEADWKVAEVAPTLSAMDRSASSSPECCGITVANFGSLHATSITYTGLLATSFGITPNLVTGDLMLSYIGGTLPGPGQPLGTMVLAAPSITPDSPEPLALSYTQTFATSAGLISQSSQIHSSVVPEPETWSLMLMGLLAVGGISRHTSRRRAA